VVLAVSSPSWRTLDASAYDSLTLTVNGPAAIDAANLPWIGLQGVSNAPSSTVNLPRFSRTGSTPTLRRGRGSRFPQGLSAVWLVLLSQFKAFWFRQGAADNVQRTIWFDEVRLTAK